MSAAALAPHPATRPAATAAAKAGAPTLPSPRGRPIVPSHPLTRRPPLQGSTGYGHGDMGREALDAVFAEFMGAEAALVRIQFMSGTHAIAAALYGVLRPGDEMLAVAGK